MIEEKIKELLINITKNVKIFIVFAFLSIAQLGLTTYLVNMPIDYSVDDLTVKKGYIINARTLKIHKIECSAIDKMSEKNKRNINDSIVNLTSKGYIICNKCNAGIKRNNELVANILNTFDKILFGNDIEDLPSKEEYIESIETMGDWYVKNIATYETYFSDDAKR